MHYFGLQRGSMLAFPLYGNFFLVLVFLVEVCLFKNPTESRETQRMLFFLLSLKCQRVHSARLPTREPANFHSQGKGSSWQMSHGQLHHQP